jgi:Fe2+ or Zn2+ uptake regulation protein
MNQTEMAQALRQAGYRLTQPRLAILRVLEENDAGLSPDEVHQQGKATCASLGLVRRVHSEQRCHGYASAGTDRHHLICQGCRRVIEFPCEGLDGLIESVRQQTGYTITNHLLELSGLCPDCQAGHGADGSKNARPD